MIKKKKNIETVSLDQDGRVFTFDERGSIVEIDLQKDTVTEWAYVGGRPLSGAFDKNGDLIVCDITKVGHLSKQAKPTEPHSNQGKTQQTGLAQGKQKEQRSHDSRSKIRRRQPKTHRFMQRSLHFAKNRKNLLF